MDYVFFSGHHRPTHEMAIYCHEAGARLLLPPHDTRESFKHYAGKNLIPQFGLERYGVESIESLEDLDSRLARGEIGGLFITLPEHIPMLRERFGDVPLAAYHMFDFIDAFREAGLRNLISPNRHELDRMGAPNQFHCTKVRDFSFIEGVVGSEPLPAAKRSGFHSYISHYERRWKRAHSEFSKIQESFSKSIDIRNFGDGNPEGRVHDLPSMHRSKATIFIKDAGVTCNAPIDSISVGTPVIAEDEELERLGLDDYVIHMVSGIRYRTVEEAIDWIHILNRDDALLDELSRRTRDFARSELRSTAEDIGRFQAFLDRLS